MNADQEYLSPRDLVRLGLIGSEKTAHNWAYLSRQSGRQYGPPTVRSGRLLRYRRSDVESWLKASQITSATP